MRLQKIIPVSAGMAGGSSDAAAVLDGMNRLFSLGLSREELRKRGLRLGADVPFCLMRGAALSYCGMMLLLTLLFAISTAQALRQDSKFRGEA